MSTKTVLFAAAAAFGAAVVNAQAAINWQYIPSACSSDCAQTIQSAYLCETTYTDSTEVYGCFCNNFPSDASTCATCLNSNNAEALGSLLTSSQSACPTAISSCFFECSFDTCASSDVACQCDVTYLENIYNCGACNTANGNTAATQLSDWQALDTSCGNQNYTAATTASFSTVPLPTINTATYTAPSLTATGGGVAATGATSELAAGSSSVSGSAAASSATTSAAGANKSTVAAGASSVSSAAAASTSKAASASSSGSKAATSTSKAASGSASASAAASSTSASSAGSIAAPALGGVVGLAGVVLALF